MGNVVMRNIVSEYMQHSPKQANLALLAPVFGRRVVEQYSEKGILPEIAEAISRWKTDWRKNLVISGFPGTGKTMSLVSILLEADSVDWLFWEARKLASELKRLSFHKPVDCWDRGAMEEAVRIPRLLILDDLNTGDGWTEADLKNFADYMDRIEKGYSKTTIITTTNHTAKEIKALATDTNQARIWRRILTQGAIFAVAPPNSRRCETCVNSCDRETFFDCEKWRKK